MNVETLIQNLRKAEKFIVHDLPRIAKIEGLNHFEESWDNQGFTDKNLKKWQPRKPPANYWNKRTRKYKKGTSQRLKKNKTRAKWERKNKGRNILISHRTETKGGHLKDSLTADISGFSITFGSDKPYAGIHNTGGKAGRGLKAEIPQRQFLGYSEILMKKIEKEVEKELKKFGF